MGFRVMAVDASGVSLDGSGSPSRKLLSSQSSRNWKAENTGRMMRMPSFNMFQYETFQNIPRHPYQPSSRPKIIEEVQDTLSGIPFSKTPIQ